MQYGATTTKTKIEIDRQFSIKFSSKGFPCGRKDGLCLLRRKNSLYYNDHPLTVVQGNNRCLLCESYVRVKCGDFVC